MFKLIEPLPRSPIDPVNEVLHGITVTDPYRWLEDSESAQTRSWLEAQTKYGRAYLDSIPGREHICKRVRELLDVETYDSLQKVGRCYFFRKRLCGQEQPCIFMREGRDGEDCLLIDPRDRLSGKNVAVKPIRVSPDGRLLLYEVKEGGTRSGAFEFFDIQNRRVLSDVLPRGCLRGFSFAPHSRSFYYVHEPSNSRPQKLAVREHVLGAPLEDDRQIFLPDPEDHLRLHIVPGKNRLGFLVYHFLDKPYTDFYVWAIDGSDAPKQLIEKAPYKLGPLLLNDGRLLAITDHTAPNFRVVELFPREGLEVDWAELIPETDVPIQRMVMTDTRIFISYVRALQTQVSIFDLWGKYLGELSGKKDVTIRLAEGSLDDDELFFEEESFTKPIHIYNYSTQTRETKLWSRRRVPVRSEEFDHRQVSFTATDGTRIPMFLVGRRDTLEGGPHPTIMTAYGGYGVPMTPQFSVFVAFLLEHGCLFAVPNIRGGSEFGREWHQAAKRRKRQVAFDDFLRGVEWLIASGRAEPQRLAIFGGSNSGLLVGAAMTQRPDLFRAVVCMVPLLDMLRYHLFDSAHVWKEEFGTAEDPQDFAALLSYSPYHRVEQGASYPATMIVSGDADQTCNPAHARKMLARLQAANASEYPIFLDYSRHRGHSPVLPLSDRIAALTDRLAFLCDQLQLAV